MFDHSDNLNYCFFGCVVISGLNFSHEFVLLSPGFIFSKNLILSLKEKLTIVTKSLIFLILKFTSVMLL